MKRRLLVLLTLFATITFAQVTHYVSPTGGNISPYTDWADAANNIQDAVDVSSTGDQVLVDDGTYTLSSNISISDGITLLSVNGYSTTIIDGNSATRCLYINHADAVVDGFTIQNGYNPSGFGGGVDIATGGTIQNCYVASNQARDGGGVAIDSDGLINNCIVKNNSARYGGGVRLLNGGIVRGSVIYNNSSPYYGGGVNIWNAGTVQNCTIVANDAPNGGGIRARSNSTIENSIIYFNTSSGANYNWETNGSSFSFSNSCSTPALPSGTGNIDADPVFENLGAENYNLTALSPTIDVGLNDAWMTGAFDIGSTQRIYNGTVDIGAYEYMLPPPGLPVLASPADFAVGVSIEPTFTWFAVLDADYHTLQITTDETFTTNVTTYSGLTYSVPTATYTVTGLANSTQYFWRVSATNAGGTSGYAAARSFITTSNITPNLTWPISGATLYSTSPFLYWWGFGSTYDLLYSINSDMSNATVINNINATFYSVSGLTSGTLYYWQVRARTSTGAIAGYSVIETFNTQPGVTAAIPIPSWPIGGAIVYTNSPTLYWYLNTNSTGLSYEVEYSTGALTGTPTTTGVTSQNITLTGLTSGITYNWQVRSTDGTTYSDWSVQESFETYSSISTTVDVIPSWPIGDATVYTSSPILYWYLDSYSSGLQYEVEYNTGALTGNPTVTGITNLNTQISGLTDGATYNWQVRSTDGINYSDWSTQESFVVFAGSSGPSVPIPSWPIGNATVYVLTPTLYWYLNSYATGLEYEVLYSASSATSGGVLQNGIATTTWSVLSNATLPALMPGATYYWQVRSHLASDPGQISNYSSVESFVTLASSSPVVLLPGSPVGNVTIETDAPTLSWILPTYSESELTYEIELANNSEMIDAEVFTDLSKATYQLSELNRGSDYFWRVRSKNEDGLYSQYSDLGTFSTIDDVTGVEKENIIPTKFNVENNYPNPFNPTTTIQYGIPEAAYVTVKIYNMLGQEIKVLVQSEKLAGTYNIMWSGNDNFGNKVSSGTYIFRVTAGNQSMTRKMLFMK